MVCKDRKSITLFSFAQIPCPGDPGNTPPVRIPDMQHMKFNINTLFCPDYHPASWQIFICFSHRNERFSLSLNCIQESSGRIYETQRNDSGMTRIIAGIISGVGNIFSCRMRKPVAIMINPPHALKSLIMAGVVSGMI